MRNMRTSSSSSSYHQERAKQAYQQGDYESALTSYGAALQSNCPAADRQVILSNMVACRLHIGGSAQAEAAVENAKQCIAMNDKWAKGHVRLASAYIALGGHSNDACNALQRAVQLDPGNPVARQMLIRELRRDSTRSSNNSSRTTATNNNNSNSNNNPLDTSELDIDSTTPASVRDQTNPNRSAPTWQDHVQLYCSQAKNWYSAQSDDKRTLIKIVVLILCLYVAFGGRFGLAQGPVKQRGNYEAGNVYDQYHHRHSSRQRQQQQQQQQQQYYSVPKDNYSSRREATPQRRSSSFHFPNLLDGSMQSMLLLSGVGYLCLRNGINPMQALFFLNMIGGRRGGHRMVRPGFGGGFGRRRRW
eukprot:scaffold22668_cov161-Cylindrotheca_fusiformis.AAC.7